MAGSVIYGPHDFNPGSRRVHNAAGELTPSPLSSFLPKSSISDLFFLHVFSFSLSLSLLARFHLFTKLRVTVILPKMPLTRHSYSFYSRFNFPLKRFARAERGKQRKLLTFQACGGHVNNSSSPANPMVPLLSCCYYYYCVSINGMSKSRACPS